MTKMGSSCRLFNTKLLVDISISILAEVYAMFKLHEKVVYPGHGVAHISKIVEKSIKEKTVWFYELTFLNQDSVILVPVDNAREAGIRSLSSQENIDTAFRVIAQPVRTVYHHELSASSWNKRNKQYQSKLRKGGLLELSEIYRDLKFMQTQKELSFGEKSLLHKTELLLAEEISLVQERNSQVTVAKMRSLCKQPHITNAEGC